MQRLTQLIIAVTLLVMLALLGNSLWRGAGLDGNWAFLIGGILGGALGVKELGAKLAQRVPGADAAEEGKRSD